jgi:cytochrome c biogenesis protein CcmG, thiol:disulfide interchange protein DsbE
MNLSRKIGTALPKNRLLYMMVILCFASTGLLFISSLSVSAAERALLRTGDQPPYISLNALHGHPVAIPDDVRGKVAIIHFWADTCGHCREELPALEAIYSRYRQRGLVIMAINVGQSAAYVRQFAGSLKLTYPILFDDAEGKAVSAYSVIGLPRTFILDRNGVIKYKIIGEATEETLRKLLQPLL